MYIIKTGEGEILAKVKSTTLADACINQIRTDAFNAKISIPRLIVDDETTCELLKTIPGDPTIEDLDLSVRAYNCLKRANIDYTSTIMAMSISDITKIRNLGPRCTAELLNKICELLCKKI